MLFDFEETFGDDYLHFYGPQLTDEVSDRDTDFTARDGGPPSIHRRRLVAVATR